MYAFNGLLPEKYRIKVSTIAYDDKTNLDITAICIHCKEDADFKKLQIVSLILTSMQRLITDQSIEQIWVCTHCHNDNKLTETMLTQNILQEPYYLKVVPKSPNRKEGMIDRTKYHIKFSVWFWSFLTELESQAAQFRDDTWERGDTMYDDLDLEAGGEETD